MTTGTELVEEARTWIGTPFKHQGRVKGVGVDCYGLIIEVSRHFGLTTFKSGGYGRRPKPSLMWAALREHMVEVPISDLTTGSILFMAFKKQPMHLAFYDNGKIIHSFSVAGRVVTHRLSEDWKSMIHGVFHFDKVDY